jgi:hypothetical protein
VEVAKTSAVEGELDNIISSRHEKRVEEEGERLAEEMWQESVRRYNTASAKRTAWSGVPTSSGLPPLCALVPRTTRAERGR